jgi:hypothetical protein
MGVTKAMFSQGYCLNEECAEFCKGVFLQGTAGVYHCFRCRTDGIAETEKHWPSRYDSLEFNQVRLEYNFWAPENRYRDICIITDESRDKPANAWNMMSPNVKTEKHAKKVATDVLAYLQRADSTIFEPNIIIRNTEIMLSFDVPMAQFKVELSNFETLLGRSRLCVDQKTTS